MTLTLTPDQGYELLGLTVTGRNGRAVAVTAGKDGRCTFTMPSGRVKVQAEFVKLKGGYATCPGDSRCPIWPYTDANPAAWYHDALHYCLENGLFCPDRIITREELAVMLWRYAGSPAATEQELAFADADQVSVYRRDALVWAVENGIIRGKGDGILDPGGTATRVEAAALFQKFFGNAE